MVSLAAFPKCYLEDITEGRMSLEEWSDQSVHLECDGLELHSGFLKSHEPTDIKEIRRRIEGLGICVPRKAHTHGLILTSPDDF